jgi:hypothetical protein
MKVGNLVKIRNCAQQGKFGIITVTPNHDPIYGPGTAIYWVLYDSIVQCFTGNQLMTQ